MIKIKKIMDGKNGVKKLDGLKEREVGKSRKERRKRGGKKMRRAGKVEGAER